MGVTIREALEGAMEEHDGADVEVPETPEPAAEAAPEPPADESAQEATGEEESPKEKTGKGRDEKGRFQKQRARPGNAAAQGEGAVGQGEAQKPGPAAAGEGAKGQQPPAPAPAAPPERAPQSLRPAEREKWASWPSEARQAFVRRDREVQAALQQSAEHRQYSESVRTTLAPYEPMLRASGNGDTMGAVRGILQTVQSLAYGAPQVRAQVLANIARGYGVDIGLLDQALAGQPGQGGQGGQPRGPASAQYRDPRVDQLFSQLEQAKQQTATARSQRAHSEMEEFFATHEFADDLRQDMADIMELGNRRGMDVSWEDAYNRAAALHPEISKVLQQREAAKQANVARTSTQRARVAASSVKAAPAGAGPAPQQRDLRSQLEDAFDEASGR